MYCITNCKIVKEDCILSNHNLIIGNRRIIGIEKTKGKIDKKFEVIDANGGYVMPGFIDIHSDYIENFVAPRPTSLMNLGLGLREAEKTLVNNGITTMYHSLSLYMANEFTGAKIKPVREIENVKNLIKEIKKINESEHLINHKLHARFEIDNFELFDTVKSLLKDGDIDLLSFMDHSPGQGQYRDLEIYRKTLTGYRNISDDEVNEIIGKHNSKEKMTVKKLSQLSKIAAKRNIPIASHDDDTEEKLITTQMLNTKISEFPITLEVAKKAKKMGMFTVLGAPNILLGGSHSGNLSAEEAILNDCVDILCSDYYPAAMLHSIFMMHEKHNIPIYKMVNRLTINPAKALNIDKDYGSIMLGKKANILVVEKNGNFPVITNVIVNAKLVSKVRYIN